MKYEDISNFMFILKNHFFFQNIVQTNKNRCDALICRIKITRQMLHMCQNVFFLQDSDYRLGHSPWKRNPEYV